MNCLPSEESSGEPICSPDRSWFSATTTVKTNPNYLANGDFTLNATSDDQVGKYDFFLRCNGSYTNMALTTTWDYSLTLPVYIWSFVAEDITIECLNNAVTTVPQDMFSLMLPPGLDPEQFPMELTTFDEPYWLWTDNTWDPYTSSFRCQNPPDSVIGSNSFTVSAKILNTFDSLEAAQGETATATLTINVISNYAAPPL